MGEGPRAGRRPLSSRQRRNLNRLEQELLADVDLCRWFDRLAGDEPQAAPGRRDTVSRRAAGSLARPSHSGVGGVRASAMFVASVLGAAGLIVAGEVLRLPALAVLAVIALVLAPVSLLVANGVERRCWPPANRPPGGARPGLPPSGGGSGMWLLP
jgi:hypothetical protein